MNITRVGVDIAKSVFHVHGVDRHDQTQWQGKHSRQKWLDALSRRVPGGAEIGMEACASSHHWARKLQQRGYRVRLIAAQFVKPYVKSNKNDMLQSEYDGKCVLFTGDAVPGWRALFEVGAEIRRVPLMRVEDTRIVGLDTAELEELGIRLGRVVRLMGVSLEIDATNASTSVEGGQALQSLLTAIAGAGCRFAVISVDPARIARMLRSKSSTPPQVG